MKKRHSFIAAMSLLSATGMTHAALYDRGNGMIYDSDQNITWLQDANYAQTSGVNASGTFYWPTATAWAENLEYGGFSDWRLPSANLVSNDTYGVSNIFSYDGSTDHGYNNTHAELGHLFTELGNVSPCDTSGACGQPNYGFHNVSFVDAGTGLTVSFVNVQLGNYWEMEQPSATDAETAWSYNTNSGVSYLSSCNYSVCPVYAWAVRDGDVAAVPVPAAAWLLGSGLIGLGGLSRRKHENQATQKECV